MDAACAQMAGLAIFALHAAAASTMWHLQLLACRVPAVNMAATVLQQLALAIVQPTMQAVCVRSARLTSLVPRAKHVRRACMAHVSLA